jgi:hypothetical protein
MNWALVTKVASDFNKSVPDVVDDAEELAVLGNEHRNTQFDDEYAAALRELTK